MEPQQSQFAETGYGPVDEFGVPIPKEFEGVHNEPERRANRELFTLELEFVQALGNPFYLYNLAVEGYMENPEFINYLRYLRYWKEPDYARFIIYPQALHHLDLLQHSRFREALKRSDTQTFLQHQQFEHWRTWRAKRRQPPEILDETGGLRKPASDLEQGPPQNGINQVPQ